MSHTRTGRHKVTNNSCRNEIQSQCTSVNFIIEQAMKAPGGLMA